MSTNKDLFKEAIADAKAVREAALTNAKAALEEALTPKLQSMIAAKLQEMGNDEEVKEVDFMRHSDTSDEMQDMGFGNTEQGRPGHGDKMNEEELEEDFDLSAILAELDAEDSVTEAKKEDEKDEIKEAEEEEVGEEEEVEDEESEIEPTEEPAEEESADGENSITDLTVDQLKDIIKDIISSELEAEEYETPGDEEAEMGGEEVGLDMGTEEQPAMEIAEEDLNEVDLEELLAELDALDETDDKDEDDAMYEAKKKKEAKEDEKDEMKEAIDTINTLRNELQEINLLNAKLLFVNKIFSAKNLTESQKVKVIASFDKATTPKQAKELYESIQSSTIGASKKSQIKESLGFASKAAGVAPKNSANSIVESNDVIARMQKLANIIK
jgi:hypothetical protein